MSIDLKAMISLSISNGMQDVADVAKFEDILLFGDGDYGSADTNVSIYFTDCLVDSAGNIYVNDTSISSSIKKFDSDGNFVSKFTGNGAIYSILFDSTEQYIYASYYVSGTDYGIKKIRISDGVVVASYNAQPDIALSPYSFALFNDKLYFTVFRNKRKLYSISLNLSVTATIEYTSPFILAAIKSEGSLLYMHASSGFEIIDNSHTQIHSQDTGTLSNGVDNDSEIYSGENSQSSSGNLGFGIDVDETYIYVFDVYLGRIRKYLKASPYTRQYNHLEGWNGQGSFPRVRAYYETLEMQNSPSRDNYFYAQYGKANIQRLNRLSTQTAQRQWTAITDGTLKGFNISGEYLQQPTWEYQINSGGWNTYDISDYTSPEEAISSDDVIYLRAVGGDFTESEKGNFKWTEAQLMFEETLATIGDPTTLTETVTSATVTLSWSTIILADGYYVQHSLAPLGTWSTLATVSITSYTVTYSDPDDQQIPHYYRVIGYNSTGNSLPTNEVVAIPNQGGEENIYKHIVNQVKSIMENDSRLTSVTEWRDSPPDQATTRAKITGWVYYTGESFNQWVALGERELHVGIEIGFHIKESMPNRRYNTNDITERKDFIFEVKEILYELKTRSLYDYCYDIEIRDEVPLHRRGASSVCMILCVFKKRIRR